ncbi:MAG: hypothetical protein RR291_06065, partial [Clostridia bacterium]
MAISISEEQVRVNDELFGKYQNLLGKLQKIKDKYSDKYVTPEMELPKSLNQTKLSYNASSTDELTDIAKKSLEADKIDKTQKISSEMSKGEDILSNKMSDLEYETDTTAKELQKLLEEKKNAVLSDAVDKGVARSSIVEEAQNEVEAEYGQNEKQLLEKKTNQLNQLTEQLNQLYARTQLALEALSKSHDAEVSEKVRALLAENIK